MDQQPSYRHLAAARILDSYERAGRWFDGIYQMLLAHLRENRRAEPAPDECARLVADIGRLGFDDYRNPWERFPNLVIDGSVLMSYARLDSVAVGAALIDAVADGACRVIVSPLAYLRIAGELQAVDGAERHVRHLLDVADAPPLTFRQTDVITRLGTGERLDVMHTALLALRHRCVIGTLEPDVYHRIGYGRVLNLAA